MQNDFLIKKPRNINKIENPLNKHLYTLAAFRITNTPNYTGQNYPQKGTILAGDGVTIITQR